MLARVSWPHLMQVTTGPGEVDAGEKSVTGGAKQRD